VPPLRVLCLPALSYTGCSVLRLMAQDDDRQVAEAAEFQQKLEVMGAAAEDAKKKNATFLRLLRS
jgi:hypothetical protein